MPFVPVKQKRRIREGVCRFCGCTERRPCVLMKNLFADIGGARMKATETLTCSWANKSKTMCNNPRCLRASYREKRREGK